MALLVGIDEAGYGPILGPLLVSGAGFRVSDDAANACLWTRLARSVSRRPAKHDFRVPICDSKKLYSSTTGLGPLERTALVMLAAADIPSADARSLLDAVAPDVGDEPARYPWYEGLNRALPMKADREGIALATNAVRRDLAAAGVAPAGFHVEPLLESRFNEAVSKTRNKACVSLGLVLRVAERFIRASDDRTVRVRVDRQGGRVRYRSQLTTAFGAREMYVQEETPARSAYRFDYQGRDLRFEFIASGESADMAIALASILSKYLRELFMTALNEYWQREIEGLRPTAGYYQDGHRFLADIKARLRECPAYESMLVRSR